MVIDETGIDRTRPSAPRGGTPAPVIPPGPTHTTTLPGIHWSAEGAAQLEPRTLPRYETIELLGEGGMGEVVRARDNDIGRDVAVKRLRPQLDHPELLARFVDEVRTVGQLEHPNIVPIHDAGVDAQGAYFVMKRVEGETVEQIIARLDRGEADAHARWPVERRLEIIRKVLEALRYAHARGVLHCDVKPANILVGPMGEVFLLDWGIARRVDAPAPTGISGTPMYMAPEQARGEAPSVRTDLYSLCLTAYELLTLRHPLAGITEMAPLLEAVKTRDPRFASMVKHPHQASVPMELGWLLRKGLSKDPAQRYESADALLRRLDDRAEGKVPIQCHVTATRRLTYEGVRLMNKSPAAYTALLLAVMGAAAWGFLHG